jgi:predicted Ser/Thr protein kinase
MSKVDTAFNFIFSSLKEESIEPIPIKEFFEDLKQNPLPNIRNVFNTFYDMIKYYVGEGKDEYPDDPESINFIDYNFDRLFVDGSDTAFFADRLFANRLMKLAESMEHGAQQNKIYVFKGPHGCGKSTFLNNLLKRFERFSNSKEGRRYEIVWRLDKTLLNAKDNLSCPMPFNIENPWQYLSSERENECSMNDLSTVVSNSKYVEIPCPSHDHPILMIPKQLRKDFIENIFGKNIFKDKKFEWIFKWKPCTVCSSIYKSLSARVSPEELFSMLYVRPYEFDRRIGNGITVFNPGDKPIKQNIITNIQLQKILNVLLGNDAVKFLHSRNVKTNNGIYALMDVKGHNVERFIDLHNIISDGVQKVEDIEEHISSLFIAVMNPEDNDNIKSIKSFEDRIEEIKIPYVLDFKTEIEIYKNTFGEEIENSFLPGVLKNFARIIVASRLNKNSDTLNA